MSRKLVNLRTLIFVAIAVTLALAWMTVGSAADPVAIKLTPWSEGNVTVVDIAVTNNTSSNINVDIKATLPAGAEFVGANPQGTFKVSGANVDWFGRINAGRTAVGYQYKFRTTGGTTSVSVEYIGATRGTVVSAPLTVGGAAAPTAGGAAQLAVTATKAPVGELKIVPVPAKAADPLSIKAQLPGTTTTVALGTTGLPNVSVGVPVALQGGSKEPLGPASTYAWTLTKPSASKSALDKNNAELVKFTPDVAGIYKVDLVASNSVGASPMASVQIRAGTYIGVEKGNCKACHAAEGAEWPNTNHAKIMTNEIDGGVDPATSHYGEGCLRCHTTGYYIGVANGGFADMQAKTGWKFPALASIQTGKGNWDAVPAQLKNVGNIQCEACHGPAAEHVANQAPMASSSEVGVCNVCHDGGGHHMKGTMLRNAKHGHDESRAWYYPTGPARTDCVRCHSSDGYISFTKNPTEKATWNTGPGSLSCTGCHDPHSDANPYQLRIVGKPVESVGLTKDYGLSATCVACHNGRVQASQATNASFPHYSTAAEMLADTGGVTYGQTVANSPHGMLIGTSPVKDPADATGKTLLFGGNTPGACVTCHMWPTIWDTKDPNYLKTGDHTFNMTSPDGTYVYTASCQACHGKIADFAFQARADYDGNGKNESVQAEVAGMMNVLRKAIGDSGVKPVDGHPYFDRNDVAKANDKQKNAIYNYLFVRGLEGSDGKANAIHNFKRSVSLLQLSYKDLTGKDVPNATLMK